MLSNIHLFKQTNKKNHISNHILSVCLNPCRRFKVKATQQLLKCEHPLGLQKSTAVLNSA